MRRNLTRRFRYHIVLALFLPVIFTACSGGDTSESPALVEKSTAFITTRLTPWAIILDRRGNLYVSDSEKGIVELIMPDGNKTVLAQGLKMPTGMAVSPGGRVYVCEALAGSVQCIHPDGTVTLVADGLLRPTGITLDRDGDLFVACRGDGSIVKIQPAF